MCWHLRLTFVHKLWQRSHDKWQQLLKCLASHGQVPRASLWLCSLTSFKDWTICTECLQNTPSGIFFMRKMWKYATRNMKCVKGYVSEINVVNTNWLYTMDYMLGCRMGRSWRYHMIWLKTSLYIRLGVFVETPCWLRKVYDIIWYDTWDLGHNEYNLHCTCAMLSFTLQMFC